MAKTTKQKIIKAVGYFPVILCLGAFCWGYYAYVFLYCQKRLLIIGAPKELRLFLEIIAHVLLVLSVWSYLMVVFVHPGTPPKALSPLKEHNSRSSSSDDETNLNILNPIGIDSDRAVIESQQLQSILQSQNEFENASPSFHITVKQNGNKRYCRKCEYEKPDRSHHCSICGECILKMDHHCPWINNCVGFYNQKFFLLFIFYTAILCTIVACSLAPGLFNLFMGQMNIDIDDVQLAFLGLLSGLFGLMLIFFVGFHIYLLVNNRTTIENLERTVYKVDQNGRPTTSKYLNVFNIGTYRNFTEVMGRKPYLWFLPVVSTEGNGVIYPLSSYAYNTLNTAE